MKNIVSQRTAYRPRWLPLVYRPKQISHRLRAEACDKGTVNLTRSFTLPVRSGSAEVNRACALIAAG
jgi:hypothetical protein